MNKFSVIFIGLLAFQGFSQDFSIPIKDHPHYDFIEWKGNGGLLMSRSPKEFMTQINLTLVGEKEEGMWDQKFNPKVRDPYFLFNENTRHIYFIDYLDLVDNGKFSFNQITFGGSIKVNIADIGIKFKRMEGDWDYNKFEMIDCAVTDKALVTHYRCYNKKEKEMQEFATFLTHHNLTVYPIQLGAVSTTKIKNGEAGQWQFAGHEGDLSYFVWREVKTDINGWIVRGFDPKGALEEDLFMNAPNDLIMVQDIGFGPTGKYYLQGEERRVLETGLISYMDGHFYLVVAQKRKGGTELVLSKLGEDGETWEEVNSKKFDYNPEFPVKLGTYAIHEGITYHLEHNGVNVASVLHFEPGVEGIERPFTDKTIYNLSGLLYEKKDTEYMSKLETKMLICDMTQFLKVGGIRFQHRVIENESE